MNRRAKYILYGLLFAACLFFLCFINYKNVSKEKELLNVADKIIENRGTHTNEEVDTEETKEIVKEGEVIGKLTIPIINVEAPIKQGTSEEVLKEAVGHFSDSGYWDGNICLASHNRGTYAHYFQNIDKLKSGDEIYYENSIGKKTYVVSNIFEISENDLYVLDDDGYNCLTMITCIKNKPNSRLCIKAVEKNMEGE